MRPPPGGFTHGFDIESTSSPGSSPCGLEVWATGTTKERPEGGKRHRPDLSFFGCCSSRRSACNDATIVTASVPVITARLAHESTWYRSVISIFIPTNARISPSPRFRYRNRSATPAAVVLDPTRWDRAEVLPPEHLEVLQRCVVDGVQVRLRYAGRDRPESERVVHPLGLVAKASVWYLVAGTDAGLRTFRLSRVREVHVTDDPVDRPAGFDLADTWRSILDHIDERRAGFRAVVRVAPDGVPWLRSAFGTRLSVRGTTDDGRIDVEIGSWSAHAVAGELAGFGDQLEAMEPAPRAGRDRSASRTPLRTLRLAHRVRSPPVGSGAPARVKRSHRNPSTIYADVDDTE